MSTFGQGLKMVPTPAWIVGIFFILLMVPLMMLVPFRSDSEMVQWPMAAKIALAILPGLLLLTYSALVGFVYADAKRRRMRHVLWAWLALVPYFVGVILYFIMRDPLPTPCPHCHTDVPRNFAFCPSCGASIHPVCRQCGKALQIEWMNCPHCGLRIAPPSVA